MSRCAVTLLTASTILGHAVFGCCLPHAHADEQHAVPVLGPETAGCCQEDEDHRGTHHTHVEGDGCTFLVAPKVQLPASPQEGCWRLTPCVVLAMPALTEPCSATQDPDLSRSGLPPTCVVRDVTQVWLL